MRGRRRHGGRGAARRGQSLVELALLLPVLALLLGGVLDMGRAFFYQIRLTNAVREGALYGAYAPTVPSTVIAQAYAEAQGRLGSTGAPGSGADFSATATCYSGMTGQVKACNSPLLTPGDTVEVVGTYTFRPFTYEIIRVWGSTFTLRKSARMPIL